jgi:hypothetical protein
MILRQVWNVTKGTKTLTILDNEVCDMGQSRDALGHITESQRADGLNVRRHYGPNDSVKEVPVLEFVYENQTETSPHHVRQQAAMQAAGEAFAQQRADVDAAFALLGQWLREARGSRQFAGLERDTEAVLVRYYNNARNGQGVTP